MAEYARFATFEADEEALQAMLREIGASDGPPEGIPATGVTVLADRAAGKVVVAVRFGSEEDLRKGSAAFEEMSPPDVGTLRRLSVDAYEVMLERQMS